MAINLLVSGKLKDLPNGLHRDGGNLFLDVRGDSRRWVFRFKREQKVTELSVGRLANRTLPEARKIAAELRQAVADGSEPKHILKPPKIETEKTFQECAEEFVKQEAPRWRDGGKTSKQWLSSLKFYSFPLIGNKPASAITVAEIRDILKPLYATKGETGTRVRQRMENVFTYAFDQAGIDRVNPAALGKLKSTLGPPKRPGSGNKRLHHASAPWEAVPAIYAALKARQSASAACLRFAILTAARSGEARGATWAEIDLAKALWTVPGERIKAGRPHTVPLSGEALAILGSRLIHSQ